VVFGRRRILVMSVSAELARLEICWGMTRGQLGRQGERRQRIGQHRTAQDKIEGGAAYGGGGEGLTERNEGAGDADADMMMHPQQPASSTVFPIVVVFLGIRFEQKSGELLSTTRSQKHHHHHYDGRCDRCRCNCNCG
jgi:hypothetical protein